MIRFLIKNEPPARFSPPRDFPATLTTVGRIDLLVHATRNGHKFDAHCVEIARVECFNRC
jgi:hypothetical protein